MIGTSRWSEVAQQAGMSRRETQVFLLAAEDGLGADDIAARLSLSVNCVRVHLSRARSRLVGAAWAWWDSRQDAAGEALAELRS